MEEYTKKGQPVLVFFENLAVLEDFFYTKEVQAMQPIRLDERTRDVNRASVVARAVSGPVSTILTRDFGRGTDFICHDNKIDKRGGVHVIQTFVSDEISEEMQIRGMP